jgi:hypothetical protein
MIGGGGGLRITEKQRYTPYSAINKKKTNSFLTCRTYTAPSRRFLFTKTVCDICFITDFAQASDANHVISHLPHQPLVTWDRAMDNPRTGNWDRTAQTITFYINNKYISHRAAIGLFYNRKIAVGTAGTLLYGPLRHCRLTSARGKTFSLPTPTRSDQF